MLLSLCFLLLTLIPSSQESCSAPGTLRAPKLNLNQTSARPGDSVLFRCFVTSQLPATRVIFCKDGEEVSSQRVGAKAIYRYNHVVSKDGSGNYTCRYEIKYSDNQVSRSWLSPAKYLRVTGDGSSSSGGVEDSSPTGLALSPAIWAARCTLVLLLLVSAPIITSLLDKQGLPQLAGLEEARGGSGSIYGRGGNGGSPLTIYEQEEG